MTNTDRVQLLVEAVRAQGGQPKVAKMLGYSTATVSLVLNDKYSGDMEKFLTRVEEVFGDRIVDCPLLGEILLGKCVEERRRPFSTANPTRVKLYRTCKLCAFNSDKNGD